jgi:transcription-repair coupling factor (superfamily II helicase)
MEIRGAGNFLGAEQSGHLNAIGYDLYCQMLREEIARLRGEEAPPERTSVKLDVPIDALLPEEYIDDPDQRILFYKRLADLAERSALESLAEELRDRYGRLPEEARNLVRLKELRILAEESGVEEVRARGGEATVRFGLDREPSPETVKEMIRSTSVDLSFQADSREGLRVRLRADDDAAVVDALGALLRAGGAEGTLIVSHRSE